MSTYPRYADAGAETHYGTTGSFGLIEHHGSRDRKTPDGRNAAYSRHPMSDGEPADSDSRKPVLGDGAAKLRLGGFVGVEEVVPDG